MSDEDRIITSDLKDQLEEENAHISFLRRNVKIRYLLGMMGFLGFAILNALRVSMSIGIVAMVDWEKLHKNSSAKSCLYAKDAAVRSAAESGPFAWQSPVQGHILASYYWGLILTQYFGNTFAEHVSAKYMLLVGTIMSSLGTALVPLVADTLPYAVIFLQVMKGLGQGFFIPAYSVLIGRWIPRTERVLATVIIGCGLPLGGFFGMASGGVICANEKLGWQYLFYIYGLIGFIWCILWVILIFDSPLTHPYITQQEMLDILETQTILPAKEYIPYKRILLSLPVWAHISVGVAAYWALSIYTIVMPLFMGTVLRFPLELNGVWSGLPHIAEMFVFIISNCINITAQKKEGNYRLSYKLSIVIGLLGFALCMLAVTFTGCNRLITVIVLVLGLGLCGFCFASNSQVAIELSNRYAGFISAVMNTIGASSGIIIPTMMGYLTRYERSMAKWSILFYISFAIAVVAAIFFLIFGSSETQEWNNPANIELTPSGHMMIERNEKGEAVLRKPEPEPLLKNEESEPEPMF